jgi:prophage antirepressor-like protein
MVTFEKHDLKLVTLEGERYMATRALALALNEKVRSLKKLVQQMRARGELKEGVHLKCIRVRTYGGPQTTILITYRGVIRIAMRSDSPRAVRFRVWAEEVLYAVMTGAGTDAQMLRSFIEKGLKQIGTANDQAAKQACDLILSLQTGEPTTVTTARKAPGRDRDHVTAIAWVRKFYPRHFFPSMNYGGKFEGYVARLHLAERGRWPQHGETKRLYAWVYSETQDRGFLEKCLLEFLKEELGRAILQSSNCTPRAITARGEV